LTDGGQRDDADFGKPQREVSKGTEAPGFNQVNLIVRDMDKTVAFYRRLGLTIDAELGPNTSG
jgi:hypothetical protein